MRVKMKSKKDLPASGSSMPEESPLEEAKALDLALEMDPHVEIEIMESVPRGGTYTKGNRLDSPMSPNLSFPLQECSALCKALCSSIPEGIPLSVDVQLKSLGTTSQVGC